MGYQLSSEEGNLESSATTVDFYQAFFTASRLVRAALTINADSADATVLQSGSTSFMQGLSNYTIEVEALYPTSAPRYGNQGFVTFASGYVPFIKSFSLDFDFGEIDITSRAAADGTALAARIYRPAHRPIVTGTFTTLVDSAAKPTSVVAANTAAAAATFKLAEGGAADPSFTGNIRTISRTGPTIGPAGEQMVEYGFQFDGAVTSVAGTTGTPALLPAGTVDGADWDASGAGLGNDIEFSTVSGTSYTGTGFLRTLRVEVPSDGPIRVTGTIRGSGVLT
jgi:hypothetical protein